MDAWKLPRPKVIEMDDLSSLSLDTCVYLRGPKDNSSLNRRCLIRDLLDPSVVDRLHESEGLTIEVSPDSAFGGAALLCGFDLYIETVHGHVSSLLHAGQCAMRSLRSTVSCETLHYPTRQDFMVSQGVPRSVVLYDVPSETEMLCSAIDSVANLLSELREKEHRYEPILFEWMFTGDGKPLFVDCKDLIDSDWHRWFGSIIKGEPGIVEATVAPSLVEVCLIRDFCSAFRSAVPPFHARVTSQALLSHFFSYTASSPRIIEMI
jgi:hypothetical protein